MNNEMNMNLNRFRYEHVLATVEQPGGEPYAIWK